MNDRHLVRGLFLIAVALAFGLQSLRYPLGQFSRPGPGLFALIVASLLLLIGLITVVGSRFAQRVPLDFNLKNIGVIVLSLCGFALLSERLNVLVGIGFLVFFSALAARTYSVVRNLQVSAGLIAIAWAFQKLLGLNLTLW